MPGWRGRLCLDDASLGEIQRGLGPGASVGDMMRELSTWWKTLPAADRQPFLAREEDEWRCYVKKGWGPTRKPSRRGRRGAARTPFPAQGRRCSGPGRQEGQRAGGAGGRGAGPAGHAGGVADARGAGRAGACAGGPAGRKGGGGSDGGAALKAGPGSDAEGGCCRPGGVGGRGEQRRGRRHGGRPPVAVPDTAEGYAAVGLPTRSCPAPSSGCSSPTSLRT